MHAPKHRIAGFGPLPMAAPEVRESTDNELKQRMLAAFETRTPSKTSVHRHMVTAFKTVDDDDDGVITLKQFLELAVFKNGKALTDKEARRLFQLLTCSPIPQLEINSACAELLASTAFTEAPSMASLPDTSPSGPPPPADSSKMLAPSQPGGIFGAAAFAEDSIGEWSLARHESPAHRRANTSQNPQAPVDKNVSGVDGGIFGKGAPDSPTSKVCLANAPACC